MAPLSSGNLDPSGGWSVLVGAVVLGEEFAAGAGAVGVAGEGEDLGVVDEAVDHGCGDDVVGEGLAPAAEGQVRGDHDRAVFVAGGDELEEQVRGVLVERDVADLVDDDQLVAADLLQLGLEASGLVGVGEAGDPVAGGVEQHRVAGVGGFDAEPDRQVGLPEPGRAEQDHVLGLRDERAGRQVRQHVAAQRGQVVEVEVLQRLHRREVRGADPHGGAGGLAVGDLALQDRGQVLLVRPVLVAGLVGEFFPEAPDRRGLQHPGQVGQHRGQPVDRPG